MNEVKNLTIKKLVFNYLLKEILYALKKIFLKIIGYKTFIRTQEYVKKSYDLQRLEKKENLNILSFNSYVYGSSPLEYSLIDNKIVFGSQKEVQERLQWIISNLIIDSGCKKVVELGSGDGRNIFALSKIHPTLKFIGLEFSNDSVTLSNEARNKFEINNAEFRNEDLLKPKNWKNSIDEDTFVFSLMVLEEIPRLYKSVIDTLKNSKVKNILFLEPIYSFSFKRTFLDIARLIRIFNRDRLFGMKSYLKKVLKKDFKLTFVDLGLGNNPINPTYFAYCKKRTIN